MDVVRVGIALVFIGMALAFVAALLPVILQLSSAEPGSVSIGGGGCIIIFFIPICFGVGEPVLLVPMLALAAVLAIASLVIGYMMFRRARSLEEEPRYRRDVV